MQCVRVAVGKDFDVEVTWRKTAVVCARQLRVLRAAGLAACRSYRDPD